MISLTKHSRKCKSNYGATESSECLRVRVCERWILKTEKRTLAVMAVFPILVGDRFMGTYGP